MDDVGFNTIFYGGGGKNDAFANMASWKCGAYVVVATVIIVLIILLNFDYLPKRKLSEELEFATRSAFKGSVVPTGGTTSKTTTSAVENSKVRPLIFHAFSWVLCKRIERFLVEVRKMFQALTGEQFFKALARHFVPWHYELRYVFLVALTSTRQNFGLHCLYDVNVLLAMNVLLDMGS